MTDHDRTSRMTWSQPNDSYHANQPVRHAEARSPVQGLMIVALRPESKARAAGMEKGDVIVECDGVGDLTSDKLAALTTKNDRPGPSRDVVFVRGGTRHTATVSPGWLGISVRATRETTPSSDDELLFVLRYRPYKVAIRLAALSVMVLLGLCGVAMPFTDGFEFKTAGAMVFYGSLAVASIWHGLGLLLGEEIRLHKTRIVKARGQYTKREIQLGNAKLVSHKFPATSFKFFVDLDRRISWGPRGIVSYDENLADPEAVSELNRLLADLSGRHVEEFTALGATLIRPFIKKGKE